MKPRRRQLPAVRACALLVWCWLLMTGGLCLAQSATPTGDAKDYDLLLSAEPKTVLPGAGRRVLVSLEGQSPVVAKVHIEVDDRLVLIMPDGRLTSIPTREATITERPFVAITKDELAKQLTAGRFQGFKTRQTKRFLYVYNTSDLFYTGTSRILETMYPGLFAYYKRQHIDVEDPAVPLVVIMFRTQEEFNAYDPKPDGVVAYYSGLSNFVVMYEESKLSRMAPDLAVKDAISTIAHEGVHQVLHNIGVQQRLSRWPMWTSEGLAEFFAPTDVSRDIRWKGVGMVNDIRMKELEMYVKGVSNRVKNGDTVHATVLAPQLTSTGYASAWALTHFLAQRRPTAFAEYQREVSELKPLKVLSPAESEQLFVKHFGKDFPALETAMVKHLQGLPYTDPFPTATQAVTQRRVVRPASPTRRASGS
jgi:hypothetical protein